RLCYICRLDLTTLDPVHPSLCIPCAAFNHASSLLSTPPRLSLPATFTAVVTGARVNLGYHTTLRLLRCGARVMATSRYPRDAVARFLAERDAAEWKDRLRVVGADFRSAADAFDLVHETRRCLRDWADGGEMKLDLLINNAAQTLTDGVKKEERAVEREQLLKNDMKNESFLIEGKYRARVRGGAIPMALEGLKSNSISYDGVEEKVKVARTEERLTPNGATTLEVEPYSKSSWIQSLFEIPYEDVISAHSVNTFVPLILCRELLPLMGTPNTETSTEPPTPAKPAAYIINISSREGIFETTPYSPTKRGKHVHTNMSKAALNMITETEAAVAWRGRRVAMNTVDPGYMSAAPEYEDAYDGVRPIGWEDGAGRVLWPVAVGEREGVAVWGRFLKHYG
ncbi:NAD(P)-binding protein, partial [Lentithecium fluviatile CBS 122367]